MKVKPIRIALAISLFVILLPAVACWEKRPEKAVLLTGVPVGIVIDLPRDLNNAEREPAVLKESAVIVSVPVAQQFYVGRERFPREGLADQMSRLFKGQAEANRIVYVAGGTLVDYRDVVEIIDSARKAGVNRIGLLVDQPSKGGDAPSLFRVGTPAEPDPNDDSNLRPHPLTLVVSLSGDLKLKLNQEPMGEAADTAKLTQMLTQIFQTRKGQRAYRPGMGTRTDISEDERVEKTIFVKAPRSIEYGYVIRIIDDIKGVGANPIILQIDDLPPVTGTEIVN